MTTYFIVIRYVVDDLGYKNLRSRVGRSQNPLTSDRTRLQNYFKPLRTRSPNSDTSNPFNRLTMRVGDTILMAILPVLYVTRGKFPEQETDWVST